MKTSALTSTLLFLLSLTAIADEGIPTILQKAEAGNPANPDYRFLWRTDPGVRYNLQTSENLSTWTDVPGYPKEAEGPVEFHDLPPVPGGKQFVQAILIDEQAPVLVDAYPAKDAIGVPRFEDFTIRLRDTTGIDPASISLTIGGQPSMSVADTPGLTFVDDILQYDAVDTAHGAPGAEISVELAVADTLGNTITYSWSFHLQEQALVLVPDVYVFASAEAQRDGQRLSARQRAMAQKIIGPVRLPANDGEGYEITAITPTTVQLTYTGADAPLIGTYLSNLAPTTLDEIFYRRVLSRTDDTTTKALTLHTEDVPLAELVDGSISNSDASFALDVDSVGNIQPALSANGEVIFGTFGVPEGVLDGSTFAIKNQDDFTVASVTAKELFYEITPSVNVGFRTRFTKLQEMYATFKARHDFAAVFEVDALWAAAKVTKTLYDLPEASEPRHDMYLGQLGPFPVYVQLRFDFKLKSVFEAGASFSTEFGWRRSFEQGITLSYVDGSGVSLTPFSDPIKTETVPFDLDLTGSFEAKLTASPSVEVLVYKLGGVGLSVEPWVKASFSVTTDVPPYEATLGVGVDLVAEPAGIVFNLLDETLRPSLEVTLWDKEFDLVDVGDQLGAAIFDSTEDPDVWKMERFIVPGVQRIASTDTHFTYNGNPIPGATGSTYPLPARVYSGNYGVATTTASATGVPRITSPPVIPPTPPNTAPTGFVLIPAGSFQMGRSSDEVCGYEELPVHSVFIDEFAIQETEVTNSQLCEVFNWALAENKVEAPEVDSRGYFRVIYSNRTMFVGGPTGATEVALIDGVFKVHPGRDVYPAHGISWFGAVLYCSLKSQMLNIPDCYDIAQNWKLDITKSGFRLPTEAEWEKAARGDITSQRFPWGNTISHDFANYRGQPQTNLGVNRYDQSSSAGFHPTFFESNEGSTNPVKFFQRYGYGLYGMAGNVAEWCHDVYDPEFYSASRASENNTTGPNSVEDNPLRVHRGGSYNWSAFWCRLSDRSGAIRGSGYSNAIGFRIVKRLR